MNSLPEPPCQAISTRRLPRLRVESAWHGGFDVHSTQTSTTRDRLPRSGPTTQGSQNTPTLTPWANPDRDFRTSSTGSHSILAIYYFEMTENGGLQGELTSDTSSCSDSLPGSESSFDMGEILQSGDEEEMLSQLREDIASDVGEISSSEDEEELLSQLREEIASHSGEGISSGESDSSSDGTTVLSQLKRQRQCRSSSSSCSGGSREHRLSVAQPPTYNSPGDSNGRAIETIGSDLGNQEEPASFAAPGSDSGDIELGPDTGLGHKEIQPPHSSSSWEVELPGSQPPQRRQNVGEIQDSSTSLVESSDVEGGDNGPRLQSTGNQDADMRPCEIADEAPQFDYRTKHSPLTIQELRSFVFHDVTVTHHIPRAAVQAFSSLHTSDRPSDYRTTKRRLNALTGVEEVRYDCCIQGCVSYAHPRYADLRECPINGCKHARFKVDGKPYAQHTFIPITHRLRLMYSDKERAREMMAYRAKMNDEMKTEVCANLAI